MQKKAKIQGKPATITRPCVTIDTIFPERTPFIVPSIKKIILKYTGSGPAVTKPKMKNADPLKTLIQSPDMLNKFNNRIVICRRRLLKEIIINGSDDKQTFIDNRLLTI